MDPAVKIPKAPEGHLVLDHIGCLCTGNETMGDVEDAAVAIDGNVIEWVGKSSDLSADLRETAERQRGVRDCSHILVATAGFINAHHHFSQVLTRGVSLDRDLFGWLTSLYDIWKHMTPEMYAAGCKAAACELILSGCTLATDHAYLYSNGMRLDDEIAAVMETGLRFQPVRGTMTVGRSKGGLPPDECVEDEEAALEDMRRLVETYHDPSKFSMLRIALGPCSPFTVSSEVMVRTARLARKYDKVLLHTHLAENLSDVKYSLEKYGQRPSAYLQSLEWGGEDCWFAHCVQLNDDDIDYFSEHRCGVAHCPSSNMRLASGIAPIRKLLDRGVPTGLGCDGSASNDSGNLLGELRLSMMLARIRDFREATDDDGTDAVPGDPTALSPRDSLHMATAGGARCLNREDELGQIAPGFVADIVGWSGQGASATALSLVGVTCDPLAGLIATAPQTVTMSIINGDFIVWDGEFVKLDLAQVVTKARAASKELFDAAGCNERAHQCVVPCS